MSLPAEAPSTPTPTRQGKASPVTQFSGEDLECQIDNWLPSLERASVWNAWTAEERLMQLAGHLKGRALQECNLLKRKERESLESVVKHFIVIWTQAAKLQLHTDMPCSEDPSQLPTSCDD